MSNNLGKRGRGLDPAVMAWLMTTLQVGPGIGDVHFLVDVDSAYYSWLRDDLKIHAAKIHHSLAAGEDALTAARNDVLCVYPGTYTETVGTTWDKRFTHMIGLGGFNTRGLDTYGTNIYTETGTVVQLINLTGVRCQFHNVCFANNGAADTALTAFKVAAYGTTLKGCSFYGLLNSDQVDQVTCSSLDIAEGSGQSGGSYLYMDNCHIGTSEWSTQGALNGQLLFSGTTGGGVYKASGILIKNTTIEGQHISTARVLIRVEAHGAGRQVVFDNCHFFAFWDNHANKSLQVFYDPGTITHDFVMHNCHATGFTDWKTTTAHVWVSSAAPNEAGGIVTTAGS